MQSRNMGVLHTAINVTDIETETEFYEDLLGLQQVREFNVNGHYNRLLGSDGSPELQLREVDEKKKPAGIEHIAVSTNNLDSVVEEAVSIWNSSIEREPTQGKNSGVRVGCITDPEGYTIELIENSDS